MNIFNFSQREQLMLAIVAVVGVVLYMEIQRNRCRCNENFIGTITPTFYRSLTSLPSVDGNVQLEPSHPYNTTANAQANAQMATRTCLFEGEKCNCCEGMECRSGACQFPQQ
jgi:hypothetical protein